MLPSDSNSERSWTRRFAFVLATLWLASPTIRGAAGDHWAFRTPPVPVVPKTHLPGWSGNPIDAFIAAKWRAAGIAPSPEADRATLLRRLSLDLTGLPPSMEDAVAFENDRRPHAYEAAVDRLLASPHFGERMGKRWLDLARYSDTDGYSGEKYREHAWRFRDWTIAAVNADLPFDRFTIAQLAGDLEPGATDAERIAAGFHRHTLTNRETGTDQEEFRVRQVVDRVNTTGSVWMGLTFACAHCHTHKYDPISQEEYFGIYAFFDNLREVDIDLEPQGRAKAQTVMELKPGERRETRVHIRGDFLNLGERVAPGTPRMLPPLKPRETEPTRLELARWLVADGHPLTARVAVNRFWQALFGQGLVRTPEDFGTQGEPPTHPELLDWLASEFVRSGWSRKHVVRLIVLSSTYRQSSRPRQDLGGRDPENRLLARQNRFRVDAELVRDLALSAGGALDGRIGGESFRPATPKGAGDVVEFYWTDALTPDERRRGLYIAIQRTVQFPMLATFDAPDGSVSCARRQRSNTPLQALTLLNAPAFVDCARRLGRRLDAHWRDSGSIEESVRRAYRICFGREPEAGEGRRVAELWRRQLALFADERERAAAFAGEPTGEDAAQLAAWTGVARALLNTDEFITRE